jgi:hypothetical protein
MEIFIGVDEFDGVLLLVLEGRAVARKICAIGEAKICAPSVRISYQQLETQKNTNMISQGN